MRRIIFLDIDGVLNGHEWCHIVGVPKILPARVAILNEICRVCEADCVLISSWRGKLLKHNWPITVAQWLLETHGFTGSLIGAISGSGHTVEEKHIGIKEFIATNAVVSYIVIDDTPAYNQYLMRPNPSIGLEPYHVSKAKELFDGQPDPKIS